MFRLEVFKKASLCRNFENETFKQLQNKNIKIPTYLSAGQEYIAATIANYVEQIGESVDIFIQHRGHSTYLSFGGDPSELIKELLGDKSGCANGMGGSASIQSIEKNIYGHDGLMGSNVTIGVGSCYASKRPTIIFVGDSAVEEDYALASIGWAATKKLPVLFVVEDNNLSILTEKKVRRSWNIHEVAQGFGVKSFDVIDDPNDIDFCLSDNDAFKEPILLNINTIRKYWHAGAGIDDPNVFDRYEDEMKDLGQQAVDIHEETKIYVRGVWEEQLNQQ